MKHAGALFVLFVLSCATALELLGSEIIITSGHRIVGKALADESRLVLELSAVYSGPVQLLVYGNGDVQSFEARIAADGQVTLSTDAGPVSLADLATRAGLELTVLFAGEERPVPAARASVGPPQAPASGAHGGAEAGRDLPPEASQGGGAAPRELVPGLPVELPVEVPVKVPVGFTAESGEGDEN